MKIKEKIFENLVPILISVLAVITVLPILTDTMDGSSPSQFGVQLFSIFIALFWIIFFIAYTASVAIKENKDDEKAYKKSVKNFKRSLLLVLIILIGSYIFAQIEIENYYQSLRKEYLIKINKKDVEYNNTIDSLKNISGRDSLISTYFFELGKDYIRTDYIKKGFDYFDSTLYYHESNYYYGVISYEIGRKLNNKPKELIYLKKAYALDTSDKYLLNEIKELEREIEEENK